MAESTPPPPPLPTIQVPGVADPVEPAAAAAVPVSPALSTQSSREGEFPLEAEDDTYATDSAYGDGAVASSTTSISSSVMRYRQENGRTYHAYKVIIFSFSFFLNCFTFIFHF